MTDQLQTLKDDLAFLRGVAESGNDTTMKGGAILAAGGFFYGAASLVSWAAADALIPFRTADVWTLWLGATAAFYAVMFLTLRKLGGGGRTPSRIAGLAWSALGGAVFTILLAFGATAHASGNAAVWGAAPSVIVAIYGAGWIVACAASGRTWMRALGLASFAAAVALGFLVGQAAQWLAYGAALILLVGVPGLVLVRRPNV